MERRIKLATRSASHSRLGKRVRITSTTGSVEISSWSLAHCSVMLPYGASYEWWRGAVPGVRGAPLYV